MKQNSLFFQIRNTVTSTAFSRSGPIQLKTCPMHALTLDTVPPQSHLQPWVMGPFTNIEVRES
jgi:hypothetical protein